MWTFHHHGSRGMGLGMLARDDALVATTFATTAADARRALVPLADGPVADDAGAFRGFLEELNSYLHGDPVEWTSPYELRFGTQFQRGVWQAIAAIPWGKSATYGELARRVHRPRAARAVGNACGANPLPIRIPCHRVLATGAALGGFTGGIEIKERLLALEGVQTKGS